MPRRYRVGRDPGTIPEKPTHGGNQMPASVAGESLPTACR